jgi:hypothetical protein
MDMNAFAHGRLPRIPGSKTVSGACLLVFALAVWGCSEGLLPVERTLSGEWTAAQDPAGSFFPEAGTFQVSLTQADTMWWGTWGAVGVGGVVVQPNQSAGGRVLGDSVVIGLGYNPYDHGCTGPSSQCTMRYFRAMGVFAGPDELRVRVLPQPHPTLPDSELNVLAEWTLTRQ